MGTTGSYTIIFNGKEITIYSNSDSYPSMLGIGLLKELSELLSIYSIDELISKFEKVNIVNEGSEPTKRDRKNLGKYFNAIDDEWIFLINHPGYLKPILKYKYAVESNLSGYEYTYIIDLDNKLLTCNECKWRIRLSPRSINKFIDNFNKTTEYDSDN
ncbi:putative ORFan [Tupanvirus deep ocean]|uniref:ORFan n=2 Tax=Tupanvirus TaxID=2094720 RepID=A0AC62A8Z2_9VIRU|nr:putative ORFan [Tupanvirus deep ocean]QKU34125.1 putative ORFan [Tupanvirus deep ocean]